MLCMALSRIIFRYTGRMLCYFVRTHVLALHIAPELFCLVVVNTFIHCYSQQSPKYLCIHTSQIRTVIG